MRYEVTADKSRLHNEEFHSLYSSPDIVRVIRYEVAAHMYFAIVTSSHIL